MRNVYAVIRHAMLCVCFALAACATPTQPSAAVVKKSPEPAPVFNFQIVSSGGADGANAVYRSGQPKGDAEWAYLERIGIKTVVKLNEFSKEADESEELSLAKKHNIDVIPIYMPPEDFPQNWNPWAHPDEKALMQAVEALENNNNLPVLVHCSHGKDRTGLVVAVYSVRNKKYCKDAALNEMKYYGTSPFLFGLKPMLDSPNIIQNPSCTHDLTVQ
jgi:Tyrosine phosphatase family